MSDDVYELRRQIRSEYDALVRALALLKVMMQEVCNSLDGHFSLLALQNAALVDMMRLTDALCAVIEVEADAKL